MARKIQIFVILICVLCSTFVFGSTAGSGASEAAIDFIRIGRGNATLVTSTQNGASIYGLIDSGTAAQYESRVKPFLTSKMGSKKLTFIAVTHLDADHANGIVGAINDFADSKTIIFLKDVATNGSGDETEQKVYDRCVAIKNAAKAKGMPIAKIRPYQNYTGDVTTISQLRSLGDNVFKAKYRVYKKNSSGNYVADGDAKETYTFGRYTMTWYNGMNWNGKSVIINNGWDENANATPIRLKCQSSSGKKFTTLLGSDLGEKSRDGYSYEIADRVADLVGKVSIYQVSHHGFYYSIKPNTTMAKLSPKYAIVTNSYNKVVNGYYENHNITSPTTNDLSCATSTLKEVCKSPDIKKVFFTEGKGSGPDNRIINVLAANNYALLEWTGSSIKAGTVTFNFYSNSMSVTQ